MVKEINTYWLLGTAAAASLCYNHEKFVTRVSRIIYQIEITILYHGGGHL